MANITLYINNTYQKVPVYDIDLESVTNTELIDAAIQEGILPECYKSCRLFCGSETIVPYYERKTLSSLGILDGGTVKIFLPPV